MPCYHPIVGYYSKDLNDSGKRSIVFQIKYAFDDKIIKVPCGRCVGCRLERSRQWAVRIMHEASLFKNNCFITLTYDSDHLPMVGFSDVPTLRKKDFQDFMKRFRHHYCGIQSVVDPLSGEESNPIRFYSCGEYGDKNGRPHFHACIFNFQFDDLVPFRKSGEFMLYKSAKLSALWQNKGHVSIGSLTFESAAYTARYIMKKMLGGGQELYDVYVDLSTGEVLRRVPEFCDMSRRPGVGSYWIDKYLSDVYPSDEVITRGKPSRPPKYYDRYFEQLALSGSFDPALYDEVMQNRVEGFKKFLDDNTYSRLLVREACALHRLQSFQKSL